LADFGKPPTVFKYEPEGWILVAKQIGLRAAVISLALLFGVVVNADDAKARIEMEKGRSAFVSGDYRAAAKAYQAAELYADTPDLKLEAIQKAAESYDKAGLKYKQFLCLKKQISGFADKIDFAKTVEKEYAIGNEFMKGHRDVTLSWLPWIKESNRAITIYETILKQVPFAKFAPMLKLKLGRMYIKNDDYKKALGVLRDLIRKHPNTEAAKYGRFELANALVQLAGKAGDGDGAYAREAEDVLNESLKLYPNDPETQWLKESHAQTDAVRAERLYKLADFYESRDNKEAAIRYFKDLVARFPENAYAAKAEKRLVKLDDQYKPRKVEKKRKADPYPITTIPEERGIMLVTPEASGGKWLLPIDDLDPDGTHAENEYLSRKKAIEAKRKREAERLARIEKRREAARKRLEAKRKKEAAEKAAEEAKKNREAERRAARLKKEAEAKLKKIKTEAERRLREEAARKAAARKKQRPNSDAPDKKPPENKRSKVENKKNKDEKGGAETKKNEKPRTRETTAAKPPAKKGADGDVSDGSSFWLDAILAVLALLLAIAAVVLLRKKKA
jgi:outer membrane protein assembly factor BamD (BamD/ComL family)